MLELLGLFIETLGVVVVILAQLVFLASVRKKYGSIKKAFLYIGGEFRTLPDDDEIAKMFDKYLLPKQLYDDFKISILGLVLSFIGNALQMLALVLGF